MNKYKISIFSVIILIIVAIAVMLFARPYRVSGDCMEPAIKDGQLCFLNRIAPYLRQYRIDDIILFKYDNKIWISRIVALENDMIQISEGSVIVNGASLNEIGIQRSWSNWKYGTYAIDKPFSVPMGHVFVLSDNLAAQHDDSRVFGPVSKESILGLIW
ncbi:MAG: Type-I signal peptidase [candidate division TM6 bacterium GW2011_GWF2_37_49]|nr:MAG: Type-I signal peptidase [candidate division TM6 bacterium GW2011_GWF2_37_49]